jgi:predicted DCC family thiol-disulfide oxidoreductase YuxK
VAEARRLRRDGPALDDGGMRTRPVLVFDGDCAFCTAAVVFAERRLRPRCDVTPWQRADLPLLGVDQQRAEYEVLWVTPVGKVYGGAQAVAKLLLGSGRGWAVLGGLLRLPPLCWVAHASYRLVANNRERMPGGTPACSVSSIR